MSNINKIIGNTQLVLFSDDTKGDKPPKDIQILKTGSFDFDLKITSEDLAEMVTNFNDDVLGKQPFIDIDHYRENSLGEITKLYTKNNNTQLWAVVNWNADGEENFQKRKYRYFSADFFTRYVHNETNKAYKNVLRGAAVTNDPRLKNMTALFSDKINNNGNKKMSKNENETDFEGLRKQVRALSDADEKLRLFFDLLGKELKIENLAEVEKSINEVQKLSDSKKAQSELLTNKDAQVQKLSADLDKLKTEVKQGNIELQFTKLLSENKIRPADKDLFIKTANLDMGLALEHFSEVKFKTSGQGKATEEGEGENLSEDDQEVRLDKSIRKLSETENISYGEATNLLQEREPQLFKHFNRFE